MQLLKAHEIPGELSYPCTFLLWVERGLIDLGPWWIISRDLALGFLPTLDDAFSRPLLPFAKRDDRDEIACFDEANTVVTVDPWDVKNEIATYEDFHEWVRDAIEVMLEWDVMECE